MQANILAVGDVVAPQGLAYLRKKLPMLRKKYEAAFTVVNGENASNVGLTPQQAEDMLDAGADVITLGNHAFRQRSILNYLDDIPYILRPANYAPQVTPIAGAEESPGDSMPAALISPFTSADSPITKSSPSSCARRPAKEVIT